MLPAPIVHVNPSLTNLARWDGLPQDESEQVARELAVPGFDFARVARCIQGGVSRYVAFFRYRDETEFALVPGGSTQQGWDPTHLPSFDERIRENWAESMASYGFPSLDEYLAATMTPLRTVVLPTLLVETAARPVGRTSGTFDHAALLSLLRRDGFRLLTSDEWEHACAAGTRTLWRWGDTCPTDEQPYGQVRFSGLKAANAFGLLIAQDPYRWEYVVEPLRMRGGDGGDALCGGYGHVATWLPLASAYIWPMFDEGSYLDEGFVRRAVSLS
jgi:hypothetical protein